ncbi:MAG: hypothetical protein MK188_04815 [Gammaproteobacteria bacterium]|nr:hypothetical protein [Gammaproteobacteria bacterium]
MLILFAFILFCASAASVTSKRNAILAILAIGFLQDPFRKLIDGEPILLIVTVGLVFALVFLNTIRQNGSQAITQPFLAWSDEVRPALLFFIAILLLQYVHSSLRYSNVIVSTIGLLSYTAPFFAIVVGYFLVDRAAEIANVMICYIGIGVLLAVTIALSFAGVDVAVFKEVGVGIKIYDQGTVLRSYSGFMRTGEIAAWHVATSSCFLIIMYFSAKKKPMLLLVLGLLVFMMAAIAFTGRRKMLMLVTLFGFVYGLAFSYYRRRLSINYLFAAGIVVFVLWGAAQYLSSTDDGVKNYIARGASVYGSVSSRAFELGFMPIGWAYERVGLLGGGLGIASQGSHLFNVSNIAGGSGEGGLGKIMVELGLPGLLSVVWLILSITRYINSSLNLCAQGFVPRHMLSIMLGIACFLLVNVITFAVATQVYGDMFILIVLGLLAGFLFALPKLVIRSLHDYSQNENYKFSNY